VPGYGAVANTCNFRTIELQVRKLQQTGVQVAIGGSNRLIGCREVADFLSVPERTVRENWRRWGLKGHKVGRAIRFRERDIEAWLQRNTI